MLRQASGAVAQRLLALQGGAATNQAGSRLLWSAALMESQAAVDAPAVAQASAAAVQQAAVPQMSTDAIEKLASKRPAFSGLGSFKLGQSARPFATFATGARAAAPAAEAAAASAAPAANGSQAGGWLRRLGAAAAALAAGLVLTAAPAMADEPEAWQILFQDSATSQMQAAVDLHHDITFFLITVVVLVSYMTFQIMTKFHYSKVAIPELITHHTLLEVIWTIVPTIIVLAVAIPSLTLIYALDQHQDRPGLTVKVIGRQWYWSYEVHDHLQQKLLDPDRLVAIAEKTILKA